MGEALNQITAATSVAHSAECSCCRLLKTQLCMEARRNMKEAFTVTKQDTLESSKQNFKDFMLLMANVNIYDSQVIFVEMGVLMMLAESYVWPNGSLAFVDKVSFTPAVLKQPH